MDAPDWIETTHAVSGVGLRVLRAGSGAPVVLVHGTGADAHSWDRLAVLLVERHEVLAYDRRGYGGSVHAPVRDYRVHVADLVSLLGSLGGAHVVGWSSGGNTAIAVAAERPDLVTTLTVLEAPFHGTRHPTPALLRTLALAKAHQLRGRPRDGAAVFARWASGRADGVSGFDLLPPAEQETILTHARVVLTELDPHPTGVMVEHVRSRSLRRLTMPVTWLLGEHTLAWYDVLRRRALRHVPHARTERIPDAGHLALVENPEAMARAVLATTAAAPLTDGGTR